MKQILDKIEFKNQVYNCKSLPFQNSNRGYDISVILESFTTSIWCGANRFLHTEVTRADKALGNIFGWKQTQAQDSYRRYFSKFTQATNQEVSSHFSVGSSRI